MFKMLRNDQLHMFMLSQPTFDFYRVTIPFFFSSWHQRVITNYIFALGTVVFFLKKRQHFFARVDFFGILEENLKMSQL